METPQQTKQANNNKTNKAHTKTKQSKTTNRTHYENQNK